MSGRLTTTHRRNPGAVVRVSFAALCALACGLLAGFGGVAGAQPTQPTDPNKIDHKKPLAADAPGKKSAEDFAVPNPERMIFAKIEDGKPVAAQSENEFEYDAWCEVVEHAKKFAAADLEQHAARNLTAIELVRVREGLDREDLTRPRGSPYRCRLLRFDGQLMYVRRLEAPLRFKNNPDLGVKELYEARLVPEDESPLMPVSIVFPQLPEALAAVREKPVGEWLDLKDAKRYVSAAGFFFKTMNVPGQKAGAVVGVPVLIGKSVTPLPGPPVPAGSDPTAIDTSLELFKFIKDETEMIRTAPTDVQWAEVAAYNRVIRHANRFTPEQLEEHALPDVKFADLFLDVRTAFKLKLVKFEGRLIRLRRMDISKNDDLQAAGVENVFEGWLVPVNEPRGNPVCIVFTEPLAGVEPADRVNKWVSFAGYSFKKMRFESAEPDPKNPSRNLHKFAPLLIGKGPIARPDPDAPTSVTWSSFVLWAIAGGVALVASAGLLTWYYRGGDRKAREAMDNVRGRNPFDATAAPPPA
ncbi:MAG: hypothetical protein J0I06_13845 [Planctomycetes bacterium]|nr:hypothetical protein [Planctomycetota bacterium]